MDFQQIILVILLIVHRTITAQKFYIVAPSSFRVNSDETAAVAVEGNAEVSATIFVQDYPGKIRNLSETHLILNPGVPQLLKFRLKPSDISSTFKPDSRNFVSLNFHAKEFSKEILVPVTFKSGYVFIQTDKPIYTPKQHVQFRIIPLKEDGLPSEDDFKFQIKNPKGIIVREKLFSPKQLTTRKAFYSYIYKFTTHPILGTWSATVLYGHDFFQNSTVQFDLEEYVLPTFTVELETQEVILNTTEFIYAKVTAKHVYGKKVQGFVTYKIGVRKFGTSGTILFGIFGPKDLVGGSYNLRIRTEDIRQKREIGWFPEIEKSQLVIEATVVDVATGNEEVVIDSKGRFSSSPFVISFDKSLKDFRPGLFSVLEAQINFVDGRPAPGISTHITVTADGKPLNVVQDTAISDDNGKVAFEFHPELMHSFVSITLETNDPRFADNQARGTFNQTKYESKQKAYIALSRSTPRRLMPNDTFSSDIHFEPETIANVYYIIISKGKILFMEKLPQGLFKAQRISFEVTHDMVPSFRVVVLAHYNEELLADSLKIEVEKVCHPKTEVSVTPVFPIAEPGNGGKILIRGPSGTLVGLVAVDEAVYALSTKDILTKDKIFNRMDKHDLGCGPGGGRTADHVLGNAGIIVGTDTFTSMPGYSCKGLKRRKREAELISTYDGLEMECCKLGLRIDEFGRTCEDRRLLLESALQGEYSNCSEAFFECCKHGEQMLSHMQLELPQLYSSRDRSFDDDFEEVILEEFLEEERIEKETVLRKDFKETWLFNDIPIGPDGREEYPVSLPHSITTWVIQAVTISPTHGLCVMKAEKVVSFKKIFLQLNIPYSVIRNEQVEIQATLFNYGMRKITAILYMYGVKDLCTGAVPGQKSERKKIQLDRQSAQSVSFPVVPLKVEDYPIKIVAVTTEGSDIIQKQLHVVPEGISKEINIPIKLDPNNLQKREKRSIQNEYYLDTIDPSQNMQVTAVNIPLPEDYVPGTASCYITAIGDHFGRIVETAVNNPQQLLIQPSGCGEQNMMRLAPTLFVMRYLKATGKITPELETTGYEYMRQGYNNQLNHRKEDGSFAIYNYRPSSTWLTAFVMKVFCQASDMIYIDEEVICQGIEWLINNQESDGSYIDYNPVSAIDIMGGIQGKMPMTSFVLIALQECRCDPENILSARSRAQSYLETHLHEVSTPMAAAITAYALALSGSSLMNEANDRLLAYATYDQGKNFLHWEDENSARAIEIAGYALLTQVLLDDVERSCSIVNWLNSQELKAGTYKSTQDTVVALQALSEYSIRAQMPKINLVSNITSSNDRYFHKVLNFNENNALVLQDAKVDKVGGTIFINTVGQGMGSLGVNLRYNVLSSEEFACKFDVIVNVTDADTTPNLDRVIPRAIHHQYSHETIRKLKFALENNIGAVLSNSKNRRKRSIELAPDINTLNQSDEIDTRKKRAAPEQNKMILEISICVRYLGSKDAERSIIDVEIFSGFTPIMKDLEQILKTQNIIENYERSTRGVVFYLEKVPMKENFCFNFRVNRDYIVWNTKRSVVKVYEYYNPDISCTKFYSPTTNSPIIRTICENGICECLEGGCPPNVPFKEVQTLKRDEKTERLEQIFCDNYSYVWNATLLGEIKRENGFLQIPVMINSVIKEGIEKRRDIEGDIRTIIARDNCNIPLHPNENYLLLGNDGEKYQNKYGDIWYRYILDKTGEIYMLTSLERSKNKELKRALDRVISKLHTIGCSL